MSASDKSHIKNPCYAGASLEMCTHFCRHEIDPLEKSPREQTDMELPAFPMQLRDQDLERAVNPRYGLVGKTRIDLLAVELVPPPRHESRTICREVDDQHFKAWQELRVQVRQFVDLHGEMSDPRQRFGAG